MFERLQSSSDGLKDTSYGLRLNLCKVKFLFCSFIQGYAGGRCFVFADWTGRQC